MSDSASAHSSSPPSSAHLMEFPTRILIGEGVLAKLGDFVDEAGGRGNEKMKEKRVVVAAGTNVHEKVSNVVSSSLDSSVEWVKVTGADMQNVERVMRAARRGSSVGGGVGIGAGGGASCIIGLGGGKSVDVGKLAAFKSTLPFFSVPTSASHDGISSPFASIKGLDRPYSVKAKPPVGILADVRVIASAPRRLLSSGCGDLVSKMTAVKDWQLAHELKGEYYGGYAASLAMMSASVVLDGSKRIGKFEMGSVRDIVEALISAGVAAGIAGSSRPCSGAEHLFSHYLDLIAPGVGLHGEKCGIGTIMMSKLHGLDWEGVRSALEDVKAPTTASETNLKQEEIVEALMKASSIRPERYTILSENRLGREEALQLAKSTGVV